MKIISSTNKRAIQQVVIRKQEIDPAIERRVTRIITAIRNQGDSALKRYASRLDKLSGPLEVSYSDIKYGAKQIPTDLRRAIKEAAKHIRRIAKRQVPKEWETMVVPGISIEQRVTPLEKIGCYVPGGRYPLPSSLLMTAIPARVAGVREVIAVCPRPDPTVFAAALEAHVSRFFQIGGAHAIAALAYGTTTVPKVDKIVGPGNKYVVAAKALVSNDCPIDFSAGPTEIVILSEKGNANWIAADLIAQAEHDPDARALLLTTSSHLAHAVERAVGKQLINYPAAKSSIQKNGLVVITKDLDEAIEIANKISPEHVVCERKSVAKKLTQAGTIFVGPYAAQAAGDYATGSNHVLPTNGNARFRGGLSASDFVRVNSIQHLNRRGLRQIAPTVISLANAEGLIAHAASVTVRGK